MHIPKCHLVGCLILALLVSSCIDLHRPSLLTHCCRAAVTYVQCSQLKARQFRAKQCTCFCFYCLQFMSYCCNFDSLTLNAASSDQGHNDITRLSWAVARTVRITKCFYVAFQSMSTVQKRCSNEKDFFKRLQS